MKIMLQILLLAFAITTNCEVLLDPKSSKTRTSGRFALKSHTLDRLSSKMVERVMPRINIGRFINVLYKGKWNSAKPNQNGFIHGKTGSILIAFGRRLDPTKLSFEFIFNEGFDIEDRLMASHIILDVTDEAQTVLTGRKDRSQIYKVQNLFSDEGQDVCNLAAEMRIYDSHGSLQPITANNVDDILIKGVISSDNCDFNVEFSVGAVRIELIGVILFVIMMIAAVNCGFMPFFRACRNNDFTEITYLSGNTFLFNIAIDMIIMAMNLTFSMRIVPEYFEFLSILTLFMFACLMFKVRTHIAIFEKELYSQNYTFEQLSRKKFNFFAKFIIVCLCTVILSNFLIVYYRLFLLLALYPIIQIFHNSYNVIRNNCFRMDLHPHIFLPQFLYPLALRCLNFKFFQLRQDHGFGITLVTILAALLAFMYMQRLFGPCFYLPKCLIPNYFEYVRNMVELEHPEDHNCPICFASLDELPDADETANKKLLPYRFMETPCQHRYHESCLKAWMTQKLICPCCRANIPPY